MDEISLSSGMVILALLVLNALVTLGYAAISNVDLGDDDNRTENFKRRAAIGGQLSLILTQFAIAAIAIYGLVLPLVNQYSDAPAWSLYVVVLLPLGLLALILGEFVPSMVGSVHAQRVSPVMLPLMRGLILLLSPLIWLVNVLSNLLLRLFDVRKVENAVTEEQFLKLVENQEIFEDDERKMIHSVMQLDETTVSEMMVPRIDMVALEKTTSIAHARQVFLDSGHSRIPVYHENIDNIIGMAYVKDLLDVWHNGDTVVESVEEIARPAQFVPETMTADQLLRFFRKNKIHLTVVLEEYGGTGGLVTLEDLLEEIVGDIQDEYDEDEFEDVLIVGEGEYRVDAGITLYDLERAIKIDLGDTEVDTLGGYIFQQLDRLPEESEVVTTTGLELTVVSLEGRRIRDVLVRVLTPEDVLEKEKEEAVESDSTDETAEESQQAS